ncbi:inter-alpha-trypsin inhibitor heavy chain H3-like [Anoplophora glabripennis]|uniref:inter-alpha-trypsin inhibitor heavy chain H3-like n=1 Tax=Anoplophora glabripennis TaxID=217634 RepID=UPI000C76B60B|nr:inter-alpha-trypsin inhibitor heavy chain H3-like [Anoplophora glabripennis]XP_023312025.1 inter-alpha-trypsin inhibitor heavy chain H3-like [Anoplophora glabripennis]XP_023312026.1 inter-alpha-trypsin inhibitor heavy chain H3-like [Anoplophora glabripennis]
MAERNLDFVFTKAIDSFSKHLHKELKKQDSNDLFSPINIHAFLTLLSQDPWFYSKDSINRALYLDVNTASTHYKDIFDVINSINNLLIANNSLLKPSQVPEAFRNRLRDNFASEVNLLDFTKLGDVTVAINTWVRDRTLQKISPFSSLRDDVNFTFLNATGFKGDWAEPFSVDETVPATFYLNEQDTVQVQMMRKKCQFYFENNSFLEAKILKLPFVNNVNLVVVLPRKEININEFVEQIPTNFLNLSDVSKNMTKQEVDVSLPKFKMEETVELAQYLKKMGLEEVFSANLSGVIKDEELTCDEIKQKAYLEINEKCLEASSATVSTLIKAQEEKVPPKDGLLIYEANISSEITNRFAKTKVVWRVKNTNKTAADADFKVILTDTAFITEFIMEIEGKSYKSYIKEKEEAKNIYIEAVAQGQSAGLVEAKTRDSREFTVSVNLEPDSVGVFSLTYEEMLQRVHDQYELVLNICPGQIVDDLNIEVRINESRPLKFVKTPPLRSGNDMNTSEYVPYLDPLSDVKIINPKTATIKFRPNSARQRKMTHYLGNKTSDGLSGQFVVQYDVEREPLNGEVLLQDGYFVHFFAPNDLDPLPKHLVFVLDTSGSMGGRKIEQLQDAIMNILSDLRKEDMLSIIEFNNDVIVWDVDSKKSATVSADNIKDFKEPFAYLQQCILSDPHLVSEDIIKKAKEVVQSIRANGCTFMIGGLETALYLVKTGQQKNKDKDQKLQPIIVFLTDGEPNVGVYWTEEIVELVTHLNTKDKVPIFSLSFGDGADKDFLRKLSLKNLGFSRHIYEAADASLQLQDFYKQISSPLLHDIKFKYDAEVAEVTRTWFPVYFRGSELVVAGRCEEKIVPTVIDCRGPRGPIIIRSATERPVTSLERLWAYLTVKQLLDEKDSSANPEELTKRAVNLALKYSFVTDVTSLVVVKPKETVPVLDNYVADLGYRDMSCVMPQSAVATGAQLDFRSRRARCLSARGVQADSDILRSFRTFGGGGPSGFVVEREDMECDSGKKPAEEFTADHPFLVFLQVEIDDAVFILFRGCVYKPTY